ncbi:MAG TPA: sigma-54 dependent transcriptional regulator [Pirellulales bacterium]|nr:sigma-54 dependent transcriptional regulator [Pirellulales bacterium]
MSRILVIDDDRSVRHVFQQVFEGTEVEVLVAGSAAEGLDVLVAQQPGVVILDIVLPDQSGLETIEKILRVDSKALVVCITASGTSDTAIEAMKLGAFDYLLKPLDYVQVRALVERALDIRRSAYVLVQVPSPAPADTVASDVFVGKCPAMQEVFKAIGRVAQHDVTVLIQGESGTGKELVARAVYQHSSRAGARYLTVNIAAIPDTLLESELFGHEKGSFTGADHKRIGRFEQSNGGTLFLDEVGDMSPLVQGKLLRLLQEQRFERVGGNETIETDVRVIAATNRDLDKMVADGEFREDLYYRLNGYTIQLPPLRERADDVLALVEHFLARFAKDLGKEVTGISPEALELLRRYPWPGNVRELQSVVRQALLHSAGPLLAPDFLPAAVRYCGDAGPGVASEGGGELAALEGLIHDSLREGASGLYNTALGCLEKFLLTRVLAHTKGNRSEAAKILGITRGSLRNKIRTARLAITTTIMEDDDDDDDEDGAEMSVSVP